MSTTFDRTFRYHPTEAPAGRLITSRAELDALGPEWVDTPAKFGVRVDDPDPPKWKAMSRKPKGDA